MALSYFIAARLSLNLALVHGQVTPIWPPTGIAVVALLVIGRRAWVAIAVAAFAVNLPIGPSLLGAAVITVGNTLAPFVSVELLRRVHFHLELDRLRDAVAVIVLGALGGMTISATIGSSVLVIAGAVPTTGFWATWAVWWTGDAMGVLLVAPLLLSLLVGPRLQGIHWRPALELAGLLLVTAVVSFLLLQNQLDLEYLVLPLIMVAAFRFRLPGAAPAALIASGVAIWSAIHGVGPFFNETMLEKMVTLQVFNVSVALASLLLASFVDTRERKEEMSRLYLATRSASEAKTQFLHMAAHELRTPISVVGGYLAILSDGSLGQPPAAWSRPLEVLTAKVGELNTIVNDLLEASRIEAKAMTHRTDRLDLHHVVEEAVERARPRASLLGGEIVTRPSPKPVPVEADTQQVGRILDNLINNALTYTVRPPLVSIAVSSEGAHAVVRVADNGAGISEAERERIFERFHRTNEPEFHGVAGTGLGLFISRQLAERHRGTLVVESSQPGNGTVFALAMPLSPATSSPNGLLKDDGHVVEVGEVGLEQGLVNPVLRPVEDVVDANLRR